jgi:hypothetical protein
MSVLTVVSCHVPSGQLRDDDARRSMLDTVQRFAPDLLLGWGDWGVPLAATRAGVEIEATLGMRAVLDPAARIESGSAVFIRKPPLTARPCQFPWGTWRHETGEVMLTHPAVELPVYAVSVHLSPWEADQRVSAATRLACFAHPSLLSIVGGNFSSVAPADPEPDWSARPHERLSKADRIVDERLASAGLVDAALAVAKRPGASGPPVARRLGAGGGAYLSNRILVSPPLAPALVHYQVLDWPGTRTCGDLPILVRLDLSAIEL